MWVEFTDPADDNQVLRCDLTWLTSAWTCIFGRGCHGIYKERPDDGCCTHGAYFSDDDDERRVVSFARELGADDWQYREAGLMSGVLEKDDEGATKTRQIDGACIFHNRPGFAGGVGCALHAHALKHDMQPLETKPDVCWQLPIRRAYRDVERPDGTSYLEITIGEYDQGAWGSGGHDMDWYCTADPEAHVGPDPVYVSCAPELRALMGDAAYDLLAKHCAEFLSSKAAARMRLVPFGKQ